MNLKILHRCIAAFLFLLSLYIYLLTIAPTLSFWDCGEFIACSVTMGVPHPPGSPLYLLLGHLFGLLPFGDIGWRVNLISALVSALTVLLLYLTIVRLVRIYRGPEREARDALMTYGGAALGALVFAFTHSFWWNAVEAEVYAISMFLTALVFYLIVRWHDEADDPGSDRWLLLIAYITGLAIGIHLLNILIIPVIALMVYYRNKGFDWGSFFIMLALTLVGFIVVYPGIVKYLPFTFQLHWIAPTLIFLGLFAASWAALAARQRLLALVFISTFLIVLGYSTYATIFIRSELNPRIDENNPDTIERFLYYLNREQYGDTGVMPRRWTKDRSYLKNSFDYLPYQSKFFWDYQINKMYNRYFLWQFVGREGDFQDAGVYVPPIKVNIAGKSITRPLLPLLLDLAVFSLPMLLGLWGLAHHTIKDRRRSFVVFALFFLTGYAIILYLNQEDPQPRERDYAYVGSFYAFAIWIGIGAQGVLEWLGSLFKKERKMALLAMGAGLVVLLAVLPVEMLGRGYMMHDRSGNYVAWDYSRNILETCAPDAILFTNGDNDTFPLWYLQEVMNIRRDVRVVNLSLLNTGWYIHQLKDQEPKVPISFEDDFIDRYLDQLDPEALMKRYWPKNDPGRTTVIDLPRPTGEPIRWDIPATMYVPTGSPYDDGKPNFLRVQDMMIFDIVRTSNWQRPIYFAVTVSTGNMLGLKHNPPQSDDHLTMEGLAFRLTPEDGRDIDPDKLLDNLLVKYRDYYRNLDNPSVHYDDNVYRLLQNYRSGFLQLAMHYQERGQPGTVSYDKNRSLDETLNQFQQLSDNDKVLFILDCMGKFLPEEVIPMKPDQLALEVGRTYASLRRPEELTKRLNLLATEPDLSADQNYQYGIYYLHLAHDTAGAAEQFRQLMEKEPGTETKLQVAAAYYQAHMNDQAKTILDEIRARGMDNETAYQVGSYYLQIGQYEQAQKTFQDLLLKDPNDVKAVSLLLETYQRGNDSTAAVKLLENWVAAHPGDTQSQARLEQYRRKFASGAP